MVSSDSCIEVTHNLLCDVMRNNVCYQLGSKDLVATIARYLVEANGLRWWILAMPAVRIVSASLRELINR